MNQEHVDKIVEAVLYEGYVLYPYRPSVKTQHRWTFGGIYPRAYSEANPGADRWNTQTQCLVIGNNQSILEITARFLHLTDRSVEQATQSPADDEVRYTPVDFMHVAGKTYQSWQEAVERKIQLAPMALGDGAGPRLQRVYDFSFPASVEVEALRDGDGVIAGRIVRRQEQIRGAIEVSAELLDPGLFRVTVRIINDTHVTEEVSKTESSFRADRNTALMRSLVSTHCILGITHGEFVSQTDPPDFLKIHSETCQNIGCWPVLVGNDGEKDTMLSSPIILYDYPQVAPESPGNLFDGLEIDEILTLRIMTLTDEERRQAASVDDRVKNLLDRTSALVSEQLMGLHGTARGMQPIGGEVRHG